MIEPKKQSQAKIACWWMTEKIAKDKVIDCLGSESVQSGNVDLKVASLRNI
jgi:hypothetical protein